MEQKSLLKKALKLEYTTVVWNIVEGLLCVIIGFTTGSVSLFAYGLESSIEVFASSLVIWDLKGNDKKREEIAVKLIGSAYLVVSAYIFFDAAQDLLAQHHPERSFLGIILLAITIVGMGMLGMAKRKVGLEMKSATVLADAKFTLIDGALAAVVIVGLFLNTLFGWWWADSAMALFLAGVAFREGIREVL